jgi:high-affinity nickel-transport protein
MQAPPADWLSLLLLTFVLGMKHGFDADHLATIDGLTRHNSRVRPALARYCGTLFSLGHGAVVMAIALGVSAAAGHWAGAASGLARWAHSSRSAFWPRWAC